MPKTKGKPVAAGDSAASKKPKADDVTVSEEDGHVSEPVKAKGAAAKEKIVAVADSKGKGDVKDEKTKKVEEKKPATEKVVKAAAKKDDKKSEQAPPTEARASRTASKKKEAETSVKPTTDLPAAQPPTTVAVESKKKPASAPAVSAPSKKARSIPPPEKAAKTAVVPKKPHEAEDIKKKPSEKAAPVKAPLSKTTNSSQESKKAESAATTKAGTKKPVVVEANNTGKKEEPKPKTAVSADVDEMKKCVSAATLKICSWNVNGIRAWVKKSGLDFVRETQPDILVMQEIKCSKPEIPKECDVPGYYTYWESTTVKEGYAGVGLLTKVKPIDVKFGLGMEKHDGEGRLITAEYDKFYLIGAYVPNSGRGLVRLAYRGEWDADFLAYVKKLDKKKPVIYTGDLNVAHQEIDLANPATNRNKTAGFTDQERNAFTTLLDAGFRDVFRSLYPKQTGAYSYWTYMANARARNVGWRLDYFVVSERLTPRVCDSTISSDIEGSDHCPISLLMAL